MRGRESWFHLIREIESERGELDQQGKDGNDRKVEGEGFESNYEREGFEFTLWQRE